MRERASWSILEDLDVHASSRANLMRSLPMREQRSRLTMAGSARYRIRLQGVIERDWLDQVSRMRISYRNIGNADAITVLTGEMLDQAELIGFLNRLYDLGLPLISVQWLGQTQEGSGIGSACAG